MPRFRMKPIEIEAHQWFRNGDHPDDGDPSHEGAIVRYYRRPDMTGTSTCAQCHRLMHEHGWIDTRDGEHVVCPGDWIITDVNGERYPCKSDIFYKTYDPVDD